MGIKHIIGYEGLKIKDWPRDPKLELPIEVRGPIAAALIAEAQRLGRPANELAVEVIEKHLRDWTEAA